MTIKQAIKKALSEGHIITRHNIVGVVTPYLDERVSVDAILRALRDYKNETPVLCFQSERVTKKPNGSMKTTRPHIWVGSIKMLSIIETDNGYKVYCEGHESREYDTSDQAQEAIWFDSGVDLV